MDKGRPVCASKTDAEKGHCRCTGTLQGMRSSGPALARLRAGVGCGVLGPRHPASGPHGEDAVLCSQEKVKAAPMKRADGGKPQRRRRCFSRESTPSGQLRIPGAFEVTPRDTVSPDIPPTLHF